MIESTPHSDAMRANGYELVGGNWCKIETTDLPKTVLLKNKEDAALEKSLLADPCIDPKYIPEIVEYNKKYKEDDATDKMVKAFGVDPEKFPELNSQYTLKYNNIPYKFNERQYIDELHKYIDSTYSEHYSGKEGNKIQVTEFIMEHCENFDWLKGNVVKYVSRFGKKDGYNRKDILKTLHYALLMLHYHDKKNTAKD